MRESIRRRMAFTGVIALVLLHLSASASQSSQESTRPGGGLTCVGVWPNKVVLLDETDHKVVSVIELQTGVPEWLSGSFDRRRLTVITNQKNVEVIDLEARKVLGHVALTDNSRRPGVLSCAISPRGRYLYAILRSAVKGVDRFTLEKAKFYVVDLDRLKVTKVLDFPKGFDGGFGFEDADYKVSADEKYLYVLKDDLVVLDLETLKEVDRIELSKPLHPGMFPVSIAGAGDPSEEPGFMTTVFSSTDPIAHRTVAGIVMINVVSRKVDLYPLGPSFPIRGRLYIGPDRKTVYAVLVNNAQDPNRRPEFCVFDLETRRLLRRAEFENRSRFTFVLSGDARHIYNYGPGSNIDIYNSETLTLEKTINLEGDITELIVFR